MRFLMMESLSNTALEAEVLFMLVTARPIFTASPAVTVRFVYMAIHVVPSADLYEL